MAGNRENEPNYLIGYGKPPTQTRFKPGHSGNQKGRPRGGRNLKTELAEEMQESIVIHEGGKRKKVSKQRAIIKRLAEKSLTGDVRAARELLLLSLRVNGSSNSQQAQLLRFVTSHGKTVSMKVM